MTNEFVIAPKLRQAKPRLSTLLKLMFSEAQAFGQKTQWLGSVIALLEPLGFQERTLRTALFRLVERKLIKIERHWDLATPNGLYEQFQQRFMPLRTMLGKRGAFTDQQAYVIRLQVSHAHQQCRRSDPLLPQELLPADWPAMAAYQTYLALYVGRAAQARRSMVYMTA